MGDSLDDALALLESYVGGTEEAPVEGEAVKCSYAPETSQSVATVPPEEEEGEVVDEPPEKRARVQRERDAGGTRRGSESRGDRRRKSSAEAPAPKVPCKFFMEGRCTKGDRCTFSHALRPHRTPEEARTGEPCRFEIAGRCLKGTECLFSHDMSRVPCRFLHVRGECPSLRSGLACRFSHAPISEAERRALFAEAMGTRDPRMPGAGIAAPAADHRDEQSFVYVPRVPRSLPPDAIVQRYVHSMSPAVAALNPFGSPLAALALPPM